MMTDTDEQFQPLYSRSHIRSPDEDTTRERRQNTTESFTLQNLCDQERQESHGPTV